jgi:DHA2 family multidrug resistance protein-like MFS transporter
MFPAGNTVRCLEGAYQVAAGQGQKLMIQARSAFEGGIGLASWVAFGLAVMAILVGWLTLRTPRIQPSMAR